MLRCRRRATSSFVVVSAAGGGGKRWGVVVWVTHLGVFVVVARRSLAPVVVVVRCGCDELGGGG